PGRAADLPPRAGLRPDSERVGAALSGPYPDQPVDRHHPHLAVADLAGARRLGDRIQHLVRVEVVDQHLDPHLRHQVHRVLRAPIDLGVALLPAVAADLAHRQAEHAERLERRLHVVQLERLDDRGHELHAETPSLAGTTLGVMASPDPPPSVLSSYAVSPCSARSSPSDSWSAGTRCLMKMLITNAMTSVMTNVYPMTLTTASACLPNRDQPPP